jgi:hypothetical protein
MIGKLATLIIVFACCGKMCETLRNSQPDSSQQTQAQEDTGAEPNAPRTAEPCAPGNPILSKKRCEALQRRLEAMQPGLDREVAKARGEFIDATKRPMGSFGNIEDMVPQAAPQQAAPQSAPRRRQHVNIAPMPSGTVQM